MELSLAKKSIDSSRQRLETSLFEVEGLSCEVAGLELDRMALKIVREGTRINLNSMWCKENPN